MNEQNSLLHQVEQEQHTSVLEEFVRKQFLSSVPELKQMADSMEDYERWQVEEPFREQVTERVQQFTDWFDRTASPSSEYRINGKFTSENLERIHKHNRADSKVVLTHLLSGITAIGDNEEMARASLVLNVRTQLDAWTQEDDWNPRGNKASIDTQKWKEYTQNLKEQVLKEARKDVFGEEDLE